VSSDDSVGDGDGDDGTGSTAVVQGQTADGRDWRPDESGSNAGAESTQVSSADSTDPRTDVDGRPDGSDTGSPIETVRREAAATGRVSIGTGSWSDAPVARLRAGARERAGDARRHRRRTAAGFAALGAAALAGGALFPGLREVMLVLGGTGLFAALLVTTLLPVRPVPTAVGRAVYDALAGASGTVAGELGLVGERVYVPVTRGESAVRLFMPQTADYRVPSDDSLADALVVTDDPRERGLSTRPTGDAVFGAYAGALPDADAETPEAAAEQLAEALVDVLGLVQTATLRPVTGDRVELTVTGSTYGRLDRFDHPVPSFVATGLARRVDRPVRLASVADEGGGRWEIVCVWEDPEDASSER
jgi:hypothetical protein